MEFDPVILARIMEVTFPIAVVAALVYILSLSDP